MSMKVISSWPDVLQVFQLIFGRVNEIGESGLEHRHWKLHRQSMEMEKQAAAVK